MAAKGTVNRTFGRTLLCSAAGAAVTSGGAAIAAAIHGAGVCPCWNPSARQSAPVRHSGCFQHGPQGGRVAGEPEALRRTHRLVHEVALADREAIPGIHLDPQQFDQPLDQPGR
jgi:hypothetical protein